MKKNYSNTPLTCLDYEYKNKNEKIILKETKKEIKKEIIKTFS